MRKSIAIFVLGGCVSGLLSGLTVYWLLQSNLFILTYCLPGIYFGALLIWLLPPFDKISYRASSQTMFVLLVLIVFLLSQITFAAAAAFLEPRTFLRELVAYASGGLVGSMLLSILLKFCYFQFPVRFVLTLVGIGGVAGCVFGAMASAQNPILRATMTYGIRLGDDTIWIWPEGYVLGSILSQGMIAVAAGVLILGTTLSNQSLQRTAGEPGGR